MIERLTKADIPVVYEIYCWYVYNSDAIFDLEPEPIYHFESRLLSLMHTCPVLVAKHEGSVIGYAYYHPAFGKQAYEYDVELTIYFRPGPHYGMAAAMYAELEKIARKQNIRWMIACITDTNRESIEFHKKHGFALSGALPDSGLKNGRWLGVVWYTKSLHSPQEYLEKDLRFIPFSKAVR